MNILFFQVPGGRARVQGIDFVLEHFRILGHFGFLCLNAMLCSGTFPCNHPRCRTCQHVSPLLTVDGPKCSINIKEHFSCHSSNLIYCISCRKSSALYIGETGRSLRERFREHLRRIEKNSPGFPVVEHFNGLNHSLSNAEIRGVKLCSGNNIFRKRLEMWLIFKLGTTRPSGMNINFTFI